MAYPADPTTLGSTYISQQPQPFNYPHASRGSVYSMQPPLPPNSPQPQYGRQPMAQPGPSIGPHPSFHGQYMGSLGSEFAGAGTVSRLMSPMLLMDSRGGSFVNMGTRISSAPVRPQATKVIIGIDFGTTYSGIAYAYTAPPGAMSEPEISLIQGWPNCGNQANSQVPTEIAYDEQNPSRFRWGFDIPNTQARLKWFKLALEHKDEQVRDKYILPPGKTILDVATDFFRALYKHAMEQLQIAQGEYVMRVTKVDFVITIPAVWSELAMSRTQQAAERAGLKTGHELSLLTEPEAAALYTLKYQQGGGAINVGDKFVVCDAGGGTVDLISYAVLQRIPYLKLEEIAVGTGDLCGSTFIDRRFSALFQKRMGAHYDTLRVAQRQTVLKNFENIKCTFRDRPDQQTYHVNVPCRDNIPEAGVVDGQFEVSRKEMRDLFNPVINQIIQLIDEQVQAANTTAASPGVNGMTVRFVLLVGGFGESAYLFMRVCEWAKLYKITVLRPHNSATAIVKGAVIRGLEKAALLSQVQNAGPLNNSQVIRRTRKHYGTLGTQRFIPGKHPESDAFIDSKSGEKMARNQIVWFINKGQPISENTILTQNYYRYFRRLKPWVDTLVVSEDDNPPSRLNSEVRILCYLHADLTRVPKKLFVKKRRYFKKYYTCNYQVHMIMESGAIKFEMWYRGKNYGAVRADYET